METAKKVYRLLTSTKAGGIYILLIAFLIGLATFIENDFGTSAAQKLIFKTHWFEFLLLLFGLSILQNIFTFRMYQRRKWYMLLFHASILVILLGAFVTRYAGFEGSMHIRENSNSNTLESREPYLNFRVVKNKKNYLFQMPVHFASIGNNHYKKSYLIDGRKLTAEVLDFVPNPVEELVDAPDGKPILWIVQGGQGGRANYFLPEGSTQNLGGTNFSFGNDTKPAPIRFEYRKDSLFFKAAFPMTRMTMATLALDTVMPGEWYPAKLRSLHSGQGINFVVKDFKPKGVIKQYAGSKKLDGTDEGAITLKLSTPAASSVVKFKGAEAYNGSPAITTLGEMKISVDYGPKTVTLPFGLKLEDFKLEKYPGTDRPASYESDVVLIDPRKNLKMPYKIYMNHVLDYDGYRFFQSSYDQDEKGTILSVNHDWWGTWISYTGYILFTIGLLAMFFTGVSRFRKLSKHLS